MSVDLDQEEAQEVAPHGGPVRRLLMKHPFWVATIFGLLFFPALKLCSVRHTPPVPVLGQIAETTARGSDGDELKLPLNVGPAWFVALLDSEDTRTTPAVVSALRDLRSRVKRERIEIPMVVLLKPGGSPQAIASLRQRIGDRSDQVYLVTADESALLQLRESLAPALGDATGELRSVARIGLIDASGQIRAGAPIGTLGLTELAQYAAALERQRAER